MLTGLIIAMRTLTALPVPGGNDERKTLSLPWFPLVGLVIGALTYGVCIACERAGLDNWPAATALIAVTLGAALTRGLHLDGLADWADGFGGGRTKEDTLRIMKDPRTGAFGVTALVLDLLARFVAVERLAEAGRLEWLIIAAVASRTAQVCFVARMPYAGTPGSLGAAFVEGAGIRHMLAAGIFGIALLAPLCDETRHAAVIVASGWIAARLFGMWCRKRIGGITGDLIGALNEFVEAGALLAGAALVR